ncbi:hypothetical protein MKZ38_003454 [Zalerion maritima]|uniref:Uncharacterized protein n=1 Tax=Zalerion maritima TaxID=339359 RepID=A0AAD5RWP2_9PEZI|nr:hypothetical protein MKZ38_003454 [Zalerion maritima]
MGQEASAPAYVTNNSTTCATLNCEQPRGTVQMMGYQHLSPYCIDRLRETVPSRAVNVPQNYGRTATSTGHAGAAGKSAATAAPKRIRTAIFPCFAGIVSFNATLHRLNDSITKLDLTIVTTDNCCRPCCINFASDLTPDYHLTAPYKGTFPKVNTKTKADLCGEKLYTGALCVDHLPCLETGCHNIRQMAVDETRYDYCPAHLRPCSMPRKNTKPGLWTGYPRYPNSANPRSIVPSRVGIDVTFPQKPDVAANSESSTSDSTLKVWHPEPKSKVSEADSGTAPRMPRPLEGLPELPSSFERLNMSRTPKGENTSNQTQPTATCHEKTCPSPKLVSGDFCANHTCRFPSCNQRILLRGKSLPLSDTVYCETHACRESGCPSLALNTNSYCPGHTCKMTRCGRRRSGSQGICDRHACKTCRKPVIPSPLSPMIHHEYCKSHTCKKQGCAAESKLMDGFCAEHAYNASFWLNKGITPSQVCREHGCEVPSCKNPKEPQPAYAAHPYCKSHTCACKDCLFIPGTADGYCSSHECREPSCHAFAALLPGYCPSHASHVHASNVQSLETPIDLAATSETSFDSSTNRYHVPSNQRECLNPSPTSPTGNVKFETTPRASLAGGFYSGTTGHFYPFQPTQPAQATSQPFPPTTATQAWFSHPNPLVSQSPGLSSTPQGQMPQSRSQTQQGPYCSGAQFHPGDQIPQPSAVAQGFYRCEAHGCNSVSTIMGGFCQSHECVVPDCQWGQRQSNRFCHYHGCARGCDELKHPGNPASGCPRRTWTRRSVTYERD